MAYRNTIPQFYQSAMPPYQAPQSMSAMIFVRGENEANNYPVGPGQTAYLFDADVNSFYIKSVDITGRPLPLKICDYTERVSNDISEPDPKQESMFITKAEFDQFKEELKSEIRKNSSYKPQYKKRED